MKRQRFFIGPVTAAALAAQLSFFVFPHELVMAAPSAAPVEEGKTVLSPKVLLAEAERARAEGRYLEAKPLYQQVLQQAPPAEVAATVQKGLSEVNIKLIFSSVLVPNSETYIIVKGNTLSKIAKKYRTTVELLKASNGLTSDRIRVGQRLKVSKAKFSVVVDKSQNTLILKDGEEVLKVYRCATGMEGITPVGNFKIANRIVDPPWYSPNGLIPPGDPRNQLGSRWLGFDIQGYGIHGTTDPDSIGKPVTHGCIRLTNGDVEELFIMLPEGAPVSIVE